MNTGTLDTTDSSKAGALPVPPGPPLEWDQDGDLIWIKTEVERSTAIERDSAPIDWAGIRSRASTFLALTSDWILLVARARAAVQVDGLSELPQALDSLTAAASGFWNTMQPALPRGLTRRSNYITWFVEGLAEGVSTGSVTGATYDNLKASLRAVVTLDEVLRPLIEDEYPGVRVLREALNDALEKTTPAISSPPQPAHPAPSTSSSVAIAAPPAADAEFPPPIDNENTADQV